MSDIIIPAIECSNCQNLVIPASYSREHIRIKLNGIGGQWPVVDVDVGDMLSIAFKKNDGAWTKIDKDYTVSIPPMAGKKIVIYAILKVTEEDNI